MSNTVKKPTKKANYSTLLDILTAAQDMGIELVGDVTYESLTEFVNREIELLNNKAVASQKRAEKKKAEGDALRERVFETLTDEFVTVKDIVNIIGDPDVSDQMVVARLSQLVELGRVEKDMVTVAGGENGKSRKLSAYRLAV